MLLGTMDAVLLPYGTSRSQRAAARWAVARAVQVASASGTRYLLKRTWAEVEAEGREGRAELGALARCNLVASTPCNTQILSPCTT